MRKLMLLLFSLMLAVVLSACGQDEDASTEDDQVVEEENNQQEETDEEADKEPDEEADKEDTTGGESSGDFSELISFMEEESQGTANIIFENTEAQTHETEGVSITLERYTLLELNDFHTDFSIPFDDQTDGGVIIAEYTITNGLENETYLMPDFYISYQGNEKFHSNFQYLLPEDVQIPKQLGPSTDYALPAGETVHGYMAYPFSPDQLQQIQDLALVQVNVPKPHDTKGDVTSTFGQESKFTLALTNEGKEKAEANKAFYNDKATFENMGEKTMLKEKADINMSEDLRDVTVTLDGYQFTEFVPNEVEAPRFSNFANGIVLLTVKFLMDNGGEEDVSIGSVSSKLTVNDGAQYTLNEGMLLNYRYDDVIATGESGELLQIYVLDQEQYEKIWKDKAFEIEIGPLRNTESQDISKGHKVSFELPQ